MKDWWPFLVACGVAIALLSFWVGAVTVTGAAPETAPHGIAEYWLERYQTVIASLAALAGAAFVVMQVRETRKQHQANVRLAMRNETEAVDSAERLGEDAIRQSRDSSSDVAAALLDFPSYRTFIAPDPQRLARIEQYSGEYVSAFVKLLLDEIRDYEKWRDEGSIVKSDIFGMSPPTFEQRMDKIFERALHVIEACKMRRKQLKSFGA